MNNETHNPSLHQHIEAILYLKAKPTSLEEIVNLTHCTPDEVQEAIIELMSDYAYRDSALEIAEDAQGYSLRLRQCYQSWLESLIPPELNTATLKTLAAIALKNPILQRDLIEIRGSSAYQHVQDLVETGFIRKRPQTEGRSHWLEITDKFHRYFEIDALPEINQS